MKRCLFVALAACSVPGFAGLAPQPYPAAGAVVVEAFAPENDGTGWAMSQTGELLYLAGTAFHKVPDQYPAVAYLYRKFLGDAARGYYIQCLDSRKNSKYLCRLSDGQARLYTKPLVLEKDSDELLGNTYVAQDGRVVSWNTSRVVLWQHDVWSELPALTAHDEGLPVILEHDGNIILVCGLLFHVIDADGKLATRRLGWKDPTYSCVQWQGPVAVRTARGLPAPEAFDMISGQPLPLPQPFAEVREPVTRLMLSMSGTVWTKTGRALYRLSPEGTARLPLPSEGNMDIVAITDGRRRAAPLERDNGWDVFFTDGQPGLSRWNAAGLEQWDARHGLTHQTIRSFAYLDDRTFWFLSGGVEARIFRVPLDGAPPEAPEGQKDDRWQTFNIRPGTRLMEMGGSLAFFTESGLALKRWDGRAFTEQPLPQQVTNGVLDGVAWDNQGHVYLRHVYRTAPFESLTEIGPATVKVLSDAFTEDPQGKMASALVRAVNRGATGFNWPGGEVTLTPEKTIWQLDRNEEVIRYYDGVAWRRVRFDGSADSLTYSPRDGIVLRTRDNRTFVYVAGLFEERAGIACVTPPESLAQPDGLDGTPLAHRGVSARHVDRKGNLWFWLGQESKAACCRTGDLRVTARGAEDPRQSDRLAIRAALEPAFKNVRYESRLSEAEAWQPLQTPAGVPVRVRFPHSGAYTCEVAAVVLGERLPHTARVTHTARVALPDTRLEFPPDTAEPLPVSRHLWRPPVAAVPTSFMRSKACELVWRPAESSEPWQPLDAGGSFPLRRLGTNGVYRLEFAAREEGFWRDDTPVRLTVRLALDDEGRLLVTLDNLLSSDASVREAARQQLEANRLRWEPLLQRLEQQTSEARARLQKLEPVRQVMRQIEENGLNNW